MSFIAFNAKERESLFSRIKLLTRGGRVKNALAYFVTLFLELDLVSSNT